jgi:hypothetical protein
MRDLARAELSLIVNTRESPPLSPKPSTNIFMQFAKPDPAAFQRSTNIFMQFAKPDPAATPRRYAAALCDPAAL